MTFEMRVFREVALELARLYNYADKDVKSIKDARDMTALARRVYACERMRRRFRT